MSNAHIVEAANNMRQAVNDVRTHLQQAQADINNQIRELDQRIIDIGNQKIQLRGQQATASNSATVVQQQILIKRLDKELKDTQKARNELNNNARREAQDLDKQAYEYESLANRLEMMA